MLQKRNLKLIAFLLIGIISSGCSDLNHNTPFSPEQSRTEAAAPLAKAANDNQRLPAFAKKLASATADVNLRAAVVQAISQSGLDEKIASLKDLLQMSVAAGTFASAISVNGEFVNAIDTHPLGIDVYFPVKAHRQAMLDNPQQDFLVTYFDGYQDDRVKRQFPAWDRSGNKIMLTTAAPPETPVLVITQCEHRGNHNTAVEAPCAEPDCGGGGGGGSNPVAVLKVIHFRLMDDNEPWTAGDPEIYVKAVYASQEVETQFPDVNDEKYYWNYCKTVYSWPFWPGGNVSKFEVWEDDGWGTGGDDLLDKQWFNEGTGDHSVVLQTAAGYAYWYRGETHGDCDHYTQLKAYGTSCP
jgi:hypothetical protein